MNSESTKILLPAAKWIFRRFSSTSRYYGFMGDIEEVYNLIRLEEGLTKSNWWLFFQILKNVPIFIIKAILRIQAMIQNYIKLFYRNFSRNKLYSYINLFGLSIGISCCLLILLFVQNELSYDSFHKNSENIYRVANHSITPSMEYTTPVYIAAMGPDLETEFSEIDFAVRFSYPYAGVLSHGDKVFRLPVMRYADKSLFEVFSFELISGDPKTSLEVPFSIIITETYATKLFGDVNPLGKAVKLDNNSEFFVTGVLKDLPDNSTIKFDALGSFSTLYQMDDIYLDWNGGHGYFTYAKLVPEVDVKQLEEKFKPFIKKHTPFLEGSTVSYRLLLQRLSDVHLYVDENIYAVLFFSGIGFIILLIACINSMNLMAARGLRRSREVGIRKVVGAEKKTLITQFLSESVLFSLFGFILALIMAYLIQPYFNSILDKNLELINLLEWEFALLIPIIVLFSGILSGLYPSIYLSSFEPAKVIKSSVQGLSSKTSLRNGLVILQFAVSIFLIIGSLTIFDQLEFVKNKKLGFNKEEILVIPLTGDEVRAKYETLKSELNSVPGVISTGASDAYPANGLTMNGYRPETETESILFYALAIDYDFLETMGINLLYGRNFNKDMASDRNAFIVNEKLVNSLSWDYPVGRKINRNGEHEIIGVVNDFHFAPLTQEIAPLVIRMKPYYGYSWLSLRVDMDTISSVVESIESKWRTLFPDVNFEFQFLDENIDRLYSDDRTMAEVFTVFTGLAIFIACMGLFCLASFSAEQRTKEIGIRKVLGSTIPEIIFLLTKEFTRWVFIANVIAWPLAWYAVSIWLEDFAYSIDQSFMTYLTAGGAAILIAIITISYLAVKAAVANPIESLRYE